MTSPQHTIKKSLSFEQILEQMENALLDLKQMLPEQSDKDLIIQLQRELASAHKKQQELEEKIRQLEAGKVIDPFQEKLDQSFQPLKTMN